MIITYTCSLVFTIFNTEQMPQPLTPKKTTKETVSEFIETFPKLADLQISFVELSVNFCKMIRTPFSINA